MLKANELRIGNYARRSTALPAFKITAKDIVELEDGWRIIQPIPLTPEILEKCGFEKIEDVDYDADDIVLLGFDTQTEGGRIVISYGKRVDMSEGIFVYSGLGDPESYGFKISNIRYLHQLQNLYYSLTQTELEVNL